MDSTTKSDSTVPEVQESALGRPTAAETGQTEEEVKKSWSRRNPDKARLWRQAYQKKNAQKIKEQRSLWRKKNPAKVRGLKQHFYSEHRDEIRAKQRAYYRQRPKKYLEYGQKWRKNNHEKKLAWDQAWRDKNREKARASVRVARKKYRDFVLYGYGSRCKCCGEAASEFLSIDHIEGGGSQHRKSLGGQIAFYRWLKENNHPPGFQILCHNCNQAKGYHGQCPHETMATPIDLFLAS